MKKTTKKEYSGEELKRHVGAILEEVKDGFKVQREYSTGINQKLDKMQDDIDSLRIEIRDTKLKVTDISYSFNLTLDKKVDKKLFLDLDSRVHKLEKA